MKSVHIDQDKTYYKMISDEGVMVLDIEFDFEEKCWMVSSKEPATAFRQKVYMGIHQKEEVVSLAIKMLRNAAESKQLFEKTKKLMLVYVIVFLLGYIVSFFHPQLNMIFQKFMPILLTLGMAYLLYVAIRGKRR